jgi:hypothetical protein
MALNFANNNSLSAITSLPASISGGAMTLLQTQTASSSATIDFTSNIDSTYDVYLFKIINCHPSSDEVDFSFQGSTNGGSSFGITMTSTGFSSYHKEDGSSSGVGYEGQLDQAQGTGFHQLSYDTSYDNDHCICGELFLYNPSSTTFVKHFKLRASNNHYQNFELDSYGAGYFNTTSAINGIQFKFGSGNIDSGVIKLYGIS